jgi:hypothetical protein
MRPAELIVSELQGLNSALSEFDNLTSDYTGPALMRESLARRKDRLLEELNAALAERVSPAAAFLIDGGPATNESVRAGFLGRMLVEFQEAVYALVQSLTEGAHLRGAYSDQVARLGTLRVAGLARGSYGVVLEGPSLPIQDDLFPADARDLQLPLDDSVGLLLDLFASAASPQRGADELLDLALAMAPRAISHIQAMASQSASHGARLKITWQNHRTEQRHVELGQVDAFILSNVLADIETTSRDERLIGKLAELSMIRDRFTLQLEDGSTRRGTIDPSIRDQVAVYMNRIAEVDLVMTVKRSLATGRLQELGHLVRISPPGEADESA